MSGESVTTATTRESAEDARVKARKARAGRLYATKDGEGSGDQHGRGGGAGQEEERVVMMGR